MHVSSSLSPHDRATAVFSLGILAAMAVIAVIAVGSAVVILGKAGAVAVSAFAVQPGSSGLR
jgi:hypothetical protein